MFRPETIFVALLLSLSCKWAECDLSVPKRETGSEEMERRLTDFVLVVVVAETSLYIPGFDEQPVSVDIIGVGPDGRTTWQIVPSKPTGTISSPSLSITGKFALSRSSFTPAKNDRPYRGWECLRPTERSPNKRG